ncbi:MAG: leucine-rich repeat protein [Paludibacteraceae bacterium]|nr:leucine-rich repeat protein [Paludibacteraceae bacterium]
MSLIPNINNQALQLLPDIALWKQQISDAINYKGGEANPNEAFTELSEDIKEIPNFNTNGCEYVIEVYKPTTLLDAYYNRFYINSVVDSYVEQISGNYIFQSCISLEKIEMPNLVTISGYQMFNGCKSLQSVKMPNLVTINGVGTFQGCSSLQNIELTNLANINAVYTFNECQSLQSVKMPNLVIINKGDTFSKCLSLQSVIFGTLLKITESFTETKINLRNITIGQNTNIDLPFQHWTATNVIAEGQSGIDELNSNLYNNLLTKLYDHSQDGQTRTLRIGWLANVSEDNIAYATDKGWTLTT